jgi:hypothetical protein
MVIAPSGGTTAVIAHGDRDQATAHRSGTTISPASAQDGRVAVCSKYRVTWRRDRMAIDHRFA